jgi:hypothetical protein
MPTKTGINETSTSTMRVELKEIPRQIQKSIETNLRIARSSSDAAEKKPSK